MDPGYVVFHPLLLYNTAMGLVYVAAAAAIWRGRAAGRRAAGAIFALNLVVLGMIVYLRGRGGEIAIDSVRAMVLRTGLWLVFFVALASLDRGAGRGGGGPLPGRAAR